MNPNFESAHYPQPLPGESANAYRAFGFFCDQGPGRTLNLAWRNYCAHCGSLIQPTEPATHATKRMTRCPGQWTRWSTQFQWVERATAFDLRVADRKRAKRAEQKEALEEQRFQFELKSQTDLEYRYEKIGETLDKYHAAPVNEITQQKDEVIDGKQTRTSTRVKAPRGGDIAKLLREQSDYRRQAILGVRDKGSSPVEAPKADHVFLRINKKAS